MVLNILWKLECARGMKASCLYVNMTSWRFTDRKWHKKYRKKKKKSHANICPWTFNVEDFSVFERRKFDESKQRKAFTFDNFQDVCFRYFFVSSFISRWARIQSELFNWYGVCAAFILFTQRLHFSKCLQKGPHKLFILNLITRFLYIYLFLSIPKFKITQKFHWVATEWCATRNPQLTDIRLSTRQKKHTQIDSIFESRKLYCFKTNTQPKSKLSTKKNKPTKKK